MNRSVNARILYWGDPPTVSTGFGVVAKNVLHALFDAGHAIDCLATNAAPDFPDRDAFPYDIVPVGGSAQDPFGSLSLARVLTTSRKYDLLFVQNDLQVAHAAAGYLRQLQQRAPLPPIVYYYPVDCSVRLDLIGMLERADRIVTCTAFGQSETLKTLGTRTPLVIPHGVDATTFRPLTDGGAARDRFRRDHGIAKDALVLCSVAANNVRKDLARTIVAFAQFRASSARAATLYLHTVPVHNGIDLIQATKACGLVVGRDVIFPRDYHPLKGLADAAMNDIYNASDLYFTTTLGEGWCLPITEAMAAGLTIVAPNHTALAELGRDGRAILYDCAEMIWVDNAGYRPLGRMDDIVGALQRAVALPAEERVRMAHAAREFARSLDWSNVTPRWVALVGDLLPRAG